MAMPDFGGTDTVAPQSLTQSAQEKLRQLVARIEKLEEEKNEQEEGSPRPQSRRAEPPPKAGKWR